jgi:YYY domain-containing protein
MLELLQMWALVELLGLLCLPLTITVLHNLPDRGWAFSKALALALFAFCIWLPLMVVQAWPFSRAFIFGVLLILLIPAAFGLVRMRVALLKLLRAHAAYIVACEVIFLGMVFLLGWIRSYGPDISGFEMFMDEGFIAAIMRSPHLPPNDMWYAGFPINYYYYAHFTAAVLAKLLGQLPSVAFNTGICMFFGLTAVNLFGVTCNIVAWARHVRREAAPPADEHLAAPDQVYPRLLPAVPYGLLTMLLGLILGNLAATQQWWRDHGDLNQFDWFAPSRVVDKTINEFPAFSFLLSCFHAHVLTLAFTIAAIALAFNLFLQREGRGIFVFGRGWQQLLTLGMTALLIGALFTMNGWDYPTYLGLALVCIALQQWLVHDRRFSARLLIDIAAPCLALILLSLLLYLPFYVSFVSPSQGLGVVDPNDRSSLGQEVLIYGLFAFIFLSFLVASVVRLPVFGGEGQAEEGGSWLARFSGELASFWVIGMLGLLALLLVRNSGTLVVAGTIAAVGGVLTLSHLRDRGQAFALLLGTLAFALVAGCELFFLRDVFAATYPRMNTVFKFYFQSWAQLSIACGSALFFILEAFRPAALTAWWQRVAQAGLQNVWTVALGLLLLAGGVYPLAGSYARTGHFAHRSNSLDGLDYLAQTDPGDYAAIRWLNEHVSGDPVILEAVGPDYSDFARISAFTGLPTVMGWVGHEYQWRVNWLNSLPRLDDFSRRSNDVDTIYTSPQESLVRVLLARYQIAYVYVGPLEQAKYRVIPLQHFTSFLQVVYAAKGVTIYKVAFSAQ